MNQEDKGERPSVLQRLRAALLIVAWQWHWLIAVIVLSVCYSTNQLYSHRPWVDAFKVENITLINGGRLVPNIYAKDVTISAYLTYGAGHGKDNCEGLVLRSRGNMNAKSQVQANFYRDKVAILKYTDGQPEDVPDNTACYRAEEGEEVHVEVSAVGHTISGFFVTFCGFILSGRGVVV